jgi:hypothetical protein
MTLADVAPAPNLVSLVTSLAPATETGALGIYQLKRLWSRAMAARAGRHSPTTLHDRHLDHLVIHASGLGLEQTDSFLGQQAPSFEEFERWIVATTGGGAPERVARINAAVAGDDIPRQTARWLAAVEASAPAISSSGIRRCLMAPLPTAARGRARCNTSTCSRRGSRNMRSGFRTRTHQSR